VWNTGPINHHESDPFVTPTDPMAGQVSGRLVDVYTKGKIGGNWRDRQLSIARANPFAVYLMFRHHARAAEHYKHMWTGSRYGATFEEAAGYLLVRADVKDKKLVPRTNEMDTDGRLVRLKKPRTLEVVPCNTLKATYERIKVLDDDEDMVVQSRTDTFPVIDFALNRFTMINAKTAADGGFQTKVSTAINFLQNLGIVESRQEQYVTKPGKETHVIDLFFLHNQEKANHTFTTQMPKGSTCNAKQVSLVMNHLKVQLVSAPEFFSGMFEQVVKASGHVRDSYSFQ
jgi:hypothetical protein